MAPRSDTPPPFADMLASLASRRVATQIWQRDTATFLPPSAAAEAHAAVRQRLGWLDAPTDAVAQVAEVEAFSGGARDDGLHDVYLLGMGGSSLCAEVLRDGPGARTSACRLTVLDTTDERAVRDVSEQLAPERSLFLVASKSGSTTEVTALERHFWSIMSQRAPDGACGAHFAAVTDPGTSLAGLAEERRYRRTFMNRPDIGGRYSALSLFGLVPAALLGLDLRALVASAQRMAASCRVDSTANPGLALAAFISAEAAAGRDKLTLLTSAPWAPLGAWIEQLVAESTGKDGRGVLPIVGEPAGAPDDYGPDRAFVAIASPDDPAPASTLALAQALEAEGRPVLRLEVRPDDLGAEFFRWEFATAVVGTVLGVNPFDEPDVRAAKSRTAAQLEALRTAGAFRVDPPLEPRAGCLLRLSRSARPRDPGPRFLAILDYLPGEAGRAGVIARVRADHRRATGQATTHGVGPRYLHSTGQYHKGGPNTGVFVLLTGVDATRTAVPGESYSFSALKHAQALGDFDALVAAGRDVAHIHVEDSAAPVGELITRAIRGLLG